MLEVGRNTRQGRDNLLAVIMLAVLLVSVAIAWSMSAVTSRPIARGVDILREIRSVGLGAYWPAEPVTLWYRVTDANNNPIAWKATRRMMVEGNFGGVNLITYDNFYAEEQWLIEPKATAGHYNGQMKMDSVTIETTIQFRDEVVTVRQPRQGRWLIAKAVAPVNFLPDGMMPLAIRQVDARQKSAIFSQVFDRIAITQAGKVFFATTRMTPTAKGVVEVVSTVGRGSSTTIYHLDETGLITKVVSPPDGETHTLTTREELTKDWPDLAEPELDEENTNESNPAPQQSDEPESISL